MTAVRCPYARQRGFTLIELIIVIVVLSVLAIVGSSIIADSFKATRIVASTQSTQDQARYAMERLAREVRQIKKTAGNYVIASVTPATSISFTNVINGADQAVTVDVSGTNLRLSYGAPVVLCSNVRAFTVKYLKVDNTAATSTADVRFVELSLTVWDDISGPGQAVTERIRIALRSS